MKIKNSPEDFRVTELAQWDSHPKGEYRIYKIRKRKLTTLEAVDRIRRDVGVSVDELAYLGLKDRQAITTQYISLKGRDIRNRIPGLHCKFMSRSEQPLTMDKLQGNRFEIVVRGLRHDQCAFFQHRARAVPEMGLPNYFDDQRFGSVRAGQGFPARALLLGQYEDAVKQILAVPGEYDPPAELARKAIIRRFWGNWPLIAKKVRGSQNQQLLEDLARKPGDYRGLFNRMPTRTRAVHMLAYQSYIWNESVGRYLQSLWPEKGLCQSYYAVDRHVFWRLPISGKQWDLVKRLRSTQFPLINHETRPKDPEMRTAIWETLKAEGLQFAHFQMKYVERAFFLEVPRDIVLSPQDLNVSEPEKDDENRGCFKLTLSFSLPPGAYATLVLKRIFKTHPFDSEHILERTWHEFTESESSQDQNTQTEPSPKGRRRDHKAVKPKPEPEAPEDDDWSEDDEAHDWEMVPGSEPKPSTKKRRKRGRAKETAEDTEGLDFVTAKSREQKGRRKARAKKKRKQAGSKWQGLDAKRARQDEKRKALEKVKAKKQALKKKQARKGRKRKKSPNQDAAPGAKPDSTPAAKPEAPSGEGS